MTLILSSCEEGHLSDFSEVVDGSFVPALLGRVTEIPLGGNVSPQISDAVDNFDFVVVLDPVGFSEPLPPSS